MAPRNPLVFLFLFFTILKHHSLLALSNNVTLDFPSLTIQNFTLLGDSYLKNGTGGLTRDVTVPTSSSGTIIYNRPIKFYDQESYSTASFSTRFTFCVGNVNPASFGHGLTFFISHDNTTLGSPGGYLGLVNSSRLTKNRFVAVEFDTKRDHHFDDPNENHVGLDIDSLVSIKTADLLAGGIDLKSGKSITAWIDYKNDVKVLNVFVSYNSSYKPVIPLLTVDIDLSEYLREEDLYVGFSGSTEGSTELHLVLNWSFETSGFVVLWSRTGSHPHNVLDTSMVIPIPVSRSTNNHSRRLALGLGVAGPTFFCVAFLVFGYIVVKKLQRIRTVKGLRAEVVAGPREFGYKELSSATKWFHDSRIIGKGAFGNVYKALFASTGMLAAVKRSKQSHEGKSEFLAELSIIACLRHKNLVHLLGWCVEKDELLLVYEFMPNGSLDRMLYQEAECGTLLSWDHRVNIAIGLASALSYLHQECEQQVIHRDVKTSNVLLDSNFNARLCDFGLARLMDHNRSPVSTLTAGTMGYLAPEYLQFGTATEKSDVFSYGVVILELACGRRPIDREQTAGEKMINLVDWVWGLYGAGRIIEAADKRLNGEFAEDEMRKLLLIGLACANPDHEERPKMRRVLRILNGEAYPMALPKAKPTLKFSSGAPLSIGDVVSDCDENRFSVEINRLESVVAVDLVG